MTRLNYISPEDPIRLVNPSLDSTSYDSEYDFPITEETVISLAEGAEAEFERQASSFVEKRVKEEKHEGIELDWGYQVYLNEQNVLDFDPSKGDSLEIRVGVDDDNWEDITEDIIVDNNRGIIEVRRAFVNFINGFYGIEDTNQRFRVSYRYGIGGESSGATTLSEGITDSQTMPVTVNVADAETIPEGSTVLINGEYFLVSTKDTTVDPNTLTLTQRSLRNTDSEEHTSGDTISFVSDDIRQAIASRTAYWLLQSDDYVDVLSQGAKSLDRQVRMEQLKDTFDETVSKYSTGTYRYV